MSKYIKKVYALEIVKRTSGDYAAAFSEIRQLPEEDVFPVRHGRWEMRGGKRYCTSCGERACVTRDSEDFWYTVGTPYCPNCGAKMDLEDEDHG